MSNVSTKFYAYDAAYRPNLATVKARPGAVAVNGYISGRYANTTTSPAAAHAAGLGWFACYEEGASELVGASRDAGRAVGRKILAAMAAKGAPLDGSLAVYPAVDVAVSAGNATSCNEGWQGVRDVVHGKVSLRAYAEGAVIDALVRAGLVDGKCWLAAPQSWAGFNVDDPNICMVQLVGTDVPGTDNNHLVTDPSALGAWWPVGSPYAHSGGGHPSGGTKVQTLSDHDVQRIAAAVHARMSGDVAQVLARATQAETAAAAALATVKTVAQVLGAPRSGVAARVATLQAAVDTLAVELKAMDTDILGLPQRAVAVDSGLVTDAVVKAVEGLTWKVGA